MRMLPEYRATLTRLAPGEPHFPAGADLESQQYMGQRTKFGGDPNWIQDWMEERKKNPLCTQCGETMTFVAQIDSIEHESRYNPNSVNALSKEQRWMFADVGMIYVFLCFGCWSAHAEFQCG